MELTPGRLDADCGGGLSAMLTDTTDLSAGPDGPDRRNFGGRNPVAGPHRWAAPAWLTARLWTVRLAGYKTHLP